jgi:glutathione peroxidase
MRSIWMAVVLVGTSMVLGAGAASQPSSVLDFTVKSNDGKSVDLSQYKGKVLLIVNTASKCGYTPQYEGLEKVYNTYKDKGFDILAFPANDFGHQEPGTNEQIREFCTSKYSVTFDLFEKIVVKGEGQAPLYQFLTSKSTDPQFAGPIKWNFTKFLISKDGKIVARYDSKVKPEDKQVTDAIEGELGK